MLITADLLCEAGYCPTTISFFRMRWPEGMEVTVGNLIEAKRLGPVDFLKMVKLAPPKLQSGFRAAYGRLPAQPWRSAPFQTAALYVQLAEAVDGPLPWPADSPAGRRYRTEDVAPRVAEECAVSPLSLVDLPSAEPARLRHDSDD
jgi:hypothetical protein